MKSLIQSQLVFQKNVSVTEWEKVLNLIFQLATETLWLRRECGVTLYETLLTLSQIPDVDAQYATLLMSKLDEYKLTKTPEGLAIWLTAVRLFPALSLPKGVWNHNDPLSGNDRAVVAKVLRDNSTDEPGAVRATGAAQTSPSFAWQIVLTQLYGRQKSSKKDNDFDKFWIEAVDSAYITMQYKMKLTKLLQMDSLLHRPVTSERHWACKSSYLASSRRQRNYSAASSVPM